MTDDLKTIADSLAKLQANGASEEAKRTAAMTSALQSISAALTELVAVAEGSAEKAGGGDYADIVEALRGLRIEAPDVTVTPTVNVEAPTVNMPETPLALTVQAGETHNHIQVPAAQVTVQPPPTWKTLKVEFEYGNGGIIYGAKITRG